MAVSVVVALTIPLPLAAMHVTLYTPGLSTITVIIVVPSPENCTVMFSSSNTIQEIMSARVAEQVNVDSSPTSTTSGMGGEVIVGGGTECVGACV